jgi:hypothetical protein
MEAVMRGTARWVGSSGLAAVLALPMFWAAAPHAHIRHPHKPAVVVHHGGATGAAERSTIVGRWSFLFGTLAFYKNARGTYTDEVTRHPPGLVCSAVNDQDGQIVLRQSGKDGRLYTGTWMWFNPANCKFAGYGQITVQLWRALPFAFVTAYPPPGYGNAPESFRITRT